MRLDKLTIGSSKDSPGHRFKNLKNVTIDFDQNHWITVVIGWNGTGKSNVLEALAIIFRELMWRRPPRIEFAFQLSYRIGEGDDQRHVEIDHDPDRKTPFGIFVTINVQDNLVVEPKREKSSLRAFLSDPANLPRYLFSYYSGESTRMYDVFAPYLRWHDEQMRAGKDPGLKRLFYALPIHSQFVLLAFLTHQTDDVVAFLREHMGLDPEDGLESVLFVLREPPWKSPEGDARFWKAKGLVSRFLDRLMKVALAPIEVKRKIPVSLWNSRELQFKYLYVKDLDALRRLVGTQAPGEFFRDLESTYVSQLIDQVRIRVKLKKNDGTVTFRELSEGEQQLLTVLGLMRFTAESESLFLLDEPDTHLNPRWSVDYLRYLKTFVGRSADGRESSHVIMTTHNPLAVAELLREQVQILTRDRDDMHISSQPPELHPRGMGYAGVVTSELFGLEAAVDSHTQALLEEKRLLATKEETLTEAERERLSLVNDELLSYGFRFEMRDPVYTEYLKARYSDTQVPPSSPDGPSNPAREREKAKRLVDEALRAAKNSKN